jgi:hypothetical protein
MKRRNMWNRLTDGWYEFKFAFEKVNSNKNKADYRPIGHRR